MRLFYYAVYLLCNISKLPKTPLQPTQSVLFRISSIYLKLILTIFFCGENILGDTVFYRSNYNNEFTLARVKISFHDQPSISFSQDILNAFESYVWCALNHCLALHRHHFIETIHFFGVTML